VKEVLQDWNGVRIVVKSEDQIVKKNMTTKRLLQEVMVEPALRLKVTALGLIVVTLCGTGLALAVGFIIGLNGHRIAEAAFYGFIIAPIICTMLSGLIISQFKKLPVERKLESIGLICCTILTGNCGVMFCWVEPWNLPRAIIGIPAGCLLLVATVLMLADAYLISGITIKGLTTKSQKPNLKTCWPIKNPKGLLLKIIALVLTTTYMAVVAAVVAPPVYVMFIIMYIGAVLTTIKIWKDYQKSKIELQNNRTETNIIGDSLDQTMSSSEKQKQNLGDVGSSDEKSNKEPEDIATKPSTILHV